MTCKLSPMEIICMKYQIQFSGKNKKNISKCCLLKILPRMLSIKEMKAILNGDGNDKSRGNQSTGPSCVQRVSRGVN